MLTNTVDANDVVDTAREWYLSTGAVAFIVTGLVVLLGLVSSIAIAKKAGYSGWWGTLFFLVPVLGPILFVLFALLKWPAIKERDEALGLLRERDIPLPSHERALLKEEERKRAIEEQARRNMEKAQRAREKAEAERVRLAGAGGAAAGVAGGLATPDASPAIDGGSPAAPASDVGTGSAAPVSTSPATASTSDVPPAADGGTDRGAWPPVPGDGDGTGADGGGVRNE